MVSLFVGVGRRLDGEKMVIALNASTGTRVIDVPVSSIELPAGSLADLWNVAARWPIDAGVLHDLKLAPHSGAVLISADA